MSRTFFFHLFLRLFQLIPYPLTLVLFYTFISSLPLLSISDSYSPLLYNTLQFSSWNHGCGCHQILQKSNILPLSEDIFYHSYLKLRVSGICFFILSVIFIFCLQQLINLVFLLLDLISLSMEANFSFIINITVYFIILFNNSKCHFFYMNNGSNLQRSNGHRIVCVKDLQSI